MTRTHRYLLLAAGMLTAALGISNSGAQTLVAHYEFEDPNDLGHDSSGLGNHANTVTNVTQEEGKFGKGAFFNESQASVFRKDGGLNGFTGVPGRTYAAWVKVDPAKSQFDGVISQDTGGCCNARLLLHPDNRPFINLTEHIDRHITGAPPLVVDEWTHYALVGTNEGGASVGRVYLNGVEVAVESFPREMGDSSSWNTYLGVGESGTAHRLTGTLDDARIYEGALTPEQILGLLTPSSNKSQFTLRQDRGNNTLEFSWESATGFLYNLRSVTDPSSPDPIDWPIYADNMDLAATPPTNALTIPFPADAARYFVIEEFPAPPVSIFSDDFESGQGGWTTGSDGAAGTDWQLGAPADPGPDLANSGANCYGTNLTSAYEIDAEVWLRSPAIDLTGVGAATLVYAEWIDIENTFDVGVISVLDAADDSLIAEIESMIDGSSTQWDPVSVTLPAAALDKVIKIEFRLFSDDFNNLAGWYIDDFGITVP